MGTYILIKKEKRKRFFSSYKSFDLEKSKKYTPSPILKASYFHRYLIVAHTPFICVSKCRALQKKYCLVQMAF